METYENYSGVFAMDGKVGKTVLLIFEEEKKKLMSELRRCVRRATTVRRCHLSLLHEMLKIIAYLQFTNVVQSYGA